MSKNSGFLYCKGIGCPRRERCVRYVESLSLPEGSWWWQYACGSDFNAVLTITSH